MKSILNRRALAVWASIVLLGGLLGMAQSASGADDGARVDLRGAAAAVSAGTPTSAEVQAVVDQPDVAQHLGVPTPSDSAVHFEVYEPTVSKTALLAIQAAVAGCTGAKQTWTGVHAWVDKSTLLGGTLYRFHTDVQWCRNPNNDRMVQWNYRRSWFTDVDTCCVSLPNDGDYVQNYATPLPTPHTGTSIMQKAVPNCVFKVGCVNTFYPWIQTVARADGTYTVTGNATGS